MFYVNELHVYLCSIVIDETWVHGCSRERGIFQRLDKTHVLSVQDLIPVPVSRCIVNCTSAFRLHFLESEVSKVIPRPSFIDFGDIQGFERTHKSFQNRDRNKIWHLDNANGQYEIIRRHL